MMKLQSELGIGLEKPWRSDSILYVPQSSTGTLGSLGRRPRRRLPVRSSFLASSAFRMSGKFFSK